MVECDTVLAWEVLCRLAGEGICDCVGWTECQRRLEEERLVMLSVANKGVTIRRSFVETPTPSTTREEGLANGRPSHVGGMGVVGQQLKVSIWRFD